MTPALLLILKYTPQGVEIDSQIFKTLQQNVIECFGGGGRDFLKHDRKPTNLKMFTFQETPYTSPRTNQ